MGESGLVLAQLFILQNRNQIRDCYCLSKVCQQWDRQQVRQRVMLISQGKTYSRVLRTSNQAIVRKRLVREIVAQFNGTNNKQIESVLKFWALGENRDLGNWLFIRLIVSTIFYNEKLAQPNKTNDLVINSIDSRWARHKIQLQSTLCLVRWLEIWIGNGDDASNALMNDLLVLAENHKRKQ